MIKSKNRTKIILVGVSGKMGQENTLYFFNRLSRLSKKHHSLVDEYELVGVLDRESLVGFKVGDSAMWRFPDKSAFVDIKDPKEKEEHEKNWTECKNIFKTAINLKVVSDLSAIPNIEDLDAVIIDFSHPLMTLKQLAVSQKYPKLKWVIGTTGFSPAQEQEIKNYAKNTAILHASNFSFGINIIVQLIKEFTGKGMGVNVDVEIKETHHSEKRDIPSGTAKMLANAVVEGKKEWLEKEIAKYTDNTDAESKLRCADLKNAIKKIVFMYRNDGGDVARKSGEIGISSSRGGSIVGQHSVHFYHDITGEEIIFSHNAQSRQVFSEGAFQSAAIISNKKPGLYCMQDFMNE